MDWLETLKKQKMSVQPSILAAFELIKREDFLPVERLKDAGVDSPVPIGFGQTNSQPSTVAFMLERLDARTGEKVLDIGCGSGWTTALLACITGPSGRVFGLEILPELLAAAVQNINKYGFVGSGRVTLALGDGHAGLPVAAPFDKIFVSAAARSVPAALVDQLKAGGRLVLPVGEPQASQALVVIDKAEDGKIGEKRFPGFIFVPLVRNERYSNQ